MRRRDSLDYYWAKAEGEEFVSQVHQKIRDFYDDLRDTEIYYVLQKSFIAYYGGDLKDTGNGNLFESSRLSRGGRQGEITNLKTNHFRNLMKHTLQLATSQRPALRCVATNSDYKSTAQTMLANGILDYYMREKEMHKHFTNAVEMALVLGEGWVHCPWETDLGEVIAVAPDDGKPVREGDIVFSVKNMTDIVRDIALKEPKHDWLCVRDYENKWDLAERYPELRDDILSQDPETFDYENLESFSFSVRRGMNYSSDQVVKWTFYHNPTDAIPDGRMVQFVGDVILFDGPLPYKAIPLYQCSPDRLLDTPYGYSPAFELLGPQQALDILTSTIITNQATNGVQNIWTQKGDSLSVTEMQGGMKHISSNEMPQPLQLTATPAEIFNFRQEIIGEMETLSGISSTVRGNPEANLKSGSALALVVSQSIQFSGLLEASATSLIEKVGQAVINQLRDFGQSTRVAYIMGEANRPFQKQFTSDDLQLVNRVTVEPINALSKTTAGKVELANNLADRGYVNSPQQYMAVMETGRLDPILEGPSFENLNIRAENEALRNGDPVMALVTDIHAAHYLEHKSLISAPEARQDAEFVARVLEHMQEHLELWRNADPAVLMMTNQPPPPPPNGATLIEEQGRPQKEGLGQMGPQQGVPQPPQPGPVPPPPPVDNPSAPQADMPNMPNMPNLPPNAPEETQAAYEQMQQGVQQ